MIPTATTTITVLRVAADPSRDPSDAAPAPSEVATNVRAHISSPTGRERSIGGTQEVVEFSLSCDPVDLTNEDTVRDEVTGEEYNVVWARQRIGFGLDHTRAGLRQIKGVTPL